MLLIRKILRKFRGYSTDFTPYSMDEWFSCYENDQELDLTLDSWESWESRELWEGFKGFSEIFWVNVSERVIGIVVGMMLFLFLSWVFRKWKCSERCRSIPKYLRWIQIHYSRSLTYEETQKKERERVQKIQEKNPFHIEIHKQIQIRRDQDTYQSYDLKEVGEKKNTLKIIHFELVAPEDSVKESSHNRQSLKRWTAHWKKHSSKDKDTSVSTTVEDHTFGLVRYRYHANDYLKTIPIYLLYDHECRLPSWKDSWSSIVQEYTSKEKIPLSFYWFRSQPTEFKDEKETESYECLRKRVKLISSSSTLFSFLVGCFLFPSDFFNIPWTLEKLGIVQMEEDEKSLLDPEDESVLDPGYRKNHEDDECQKSDYENVAREMMSSFQSFDKTNTKTNSQWILCIHHSSALLEDRDPFTFIY